MNLNSGIRAKIKKYRLENVAGPIRWILNTSNQLDPLLSVSWDYLKEEELHEFKLSKAEENESIKFRYVDLEDMLGTDSLKKEVGSKLKQAIEKINERYEKKRPEYLSKILKVLKAYFERDPDAPVYSEILSSQLKLDQNILRPLIKYLEGKRAVKVIWLVSGEFQTTITSEGIDLLGTYSNSDFVVEKRYEIHKESFVADKILDSDNEYRCFVIMPIGEEGTIEHENNLSVYSKIIKPCVENSGYKISCVMADLIGEGGSIPKQIIDHLFNCDIVIGDLRRKNPNVLWELGVRHAFRKRSILVCSDIKQNIFDTFTYRAAKYYINGESNQKFYKKIKTYLKDIIHNPEKSDNPVWDYYPANSLLKELKVSTEAKEYKLGHGISNGKLTFVSGNFKVLIDNRSSVKNTVKSFGISCPEISKKVILDPYKTTKTPITIPDNELVSLEAFFKFEKPIIGPDEAKKKEFNVQVSIVDKDNKEYKLYVPSKLS